MAKEHKYKGDMVGAEAPEEHEFIEATDHQIRCKWCGTIKP